MSIQNWIEIENISVQSDKNEIKWKRCFFFIQEGMVAPIVVPCPLSLPILEALFRPFKWDIIVFRISFGSYLVSENAFLKFACTV